MINNPKHGWCDFQMGDFTGHPSYLTDVPVELLEGFLDGLLTHRRNIYFDQEGTTFVLVLSPDGVYIIEEKDEPVLHTFPDLTIKSLAREAAADVERDMDGWLYDFMLWNIIDTEDAKIKDYLEWLIARIREVADAGSDTEWTKEYDKSLEKSYPKKITHPGVYDNEGKWHTWNGIDGRPYDLCPSCGVNLCTDGEPIEVKRKMRFCSNCGQKLDWSKE